MTTATTARWALITGAKGADKSGAAARVAEMLAARGIRVGGVIQSPVREGGETVAYRARRVGSPGDELLLGRRGAAPEGARAEALCEHCSFVFDLDAFAETASWIRRAAAERDVIVIDEVSKLEASGGGHHDAIRDALGARALVVLVVRADQLFAIVERFGLGEAVATFDVGGGDDPSELVELVARAASAGAAI